VPNDIVNLRAWTRDTGGDDLDGVAVRLRRPLGLGSVPDRLPEQAQADVEALSLQVGGHDDHFVQSTAGDLALTVARVRDTMPGPLELLLGPVQQHSADHVSPW
jgi:hypothetical protein